MRKKQMKMADFILQNSVAYSKRSRFVSCALDEMSVVSRRFQEHMKFWKGEQCFSIGKIPLQQVETDNSSQEA